MMIKEKEFTCRICGCRYHMKAKKSFYCNECGRNKRSMDVMLRRKKEHPETVIGCGSGGNQRGEKNHRYDPETNTFNEIATAIMGRQPTYMEFSPSGDGIHLWFKGTKPKGASKNTDTGVEMYDSVRYFTVTDNPIPGCMETVAEALPDTLSWIHENYLKKKQKAKKKPKKKAGEKLTDEEIIEKATDAGNGEAFAELMAGKWEGKYPSQSEADMALCMKLAFWSGKDKEQMDRIFRTSGLFREKWDQKHHADGATYGEETLERAIENTDTVYSSTGDSPIFEYDGRYFRVKGDNVYSSIYNPVFNTQ